MDDIQTAQWVESREMFWPHKITFTTEYWIRLHPLARAWRNDHGDGASTHDVTDERGHFHTASSWDNCVHSTMAAPLTQADLIREVAVPVRTWVRSDMTTADEVSDLAPGWSYDRLAISGSELLRFDDRYVSGNFEITRSLWVDRETGRFVRNQRTEKDLVSGREVALVRSDNYRFNEEPPVGIFEMPAGKPIESRDPQRAFRDEWSSMDPSERDAIVGLINRSNQALINGDWDQASSIWSFEAGDYAPGERQWRTWMETYFRSWSVCKAEITSAFRNSGLSVQIGAHTYSGTNARRDVWFIRAHLRIVWAEDGDTWEGDTRYFLVPSDQGLRIAHWELPLEEIKAAHYKLKEG